MVAVALPLPSRVRALTLKRPPADVVGVAIVVCLSIIATWPLLSGGTMIGQDTATFFYPVYHFLGEQLGRGHIPGWNPYQFSGVPFAADPESGWMYLPAMVLFTALPVSIAAPAFLFGHLLLAGLSTYGLARALRMNIVGALVAATAYEFTGLLYGRSVCCPAYLQVTAWIPLVFLCMEMAIQSREWLVRACWWGTAGLALSQIFAAWLGQGSYYALLALGGYIGYRTLLAPPDFASSGRDRLVAAVTHGGAVLTFAFGLAAAGILPRLEYNALTNLAQGYSGDLAWASVLGGWSTKAMVAKLLGPTLTYAGGATVALAIIGLLVARQRFAAPYFAFLALAAVILSAKTPNRLQELLYAVLPKFEELHRHWPERVMVVFYLGLALLAGAAVSALPCWRRRPEIIAAVSGLPIVAALFLRAHGYAIPHATLQPLVAACLLVVAYGVVRWAPLRRTLTVLLLLVVFLDLRAAGQYIMQHGLYGGFYKVNLDAYYNPGGAGRFLLTHQDVDGQPVRFFGYDPSIMRLDQYQAALYRYQFIKPEAAVLVVNNRATMFGLQDVQGYNPLQLQRYVDYINALNGQTQEYHGSYVLASGLQSPLLNLLNARYIVIPANIPFERGDLLSLVATYPTVYQDESVRVLENRAALPRAWLVHAARRVSATDSLALLADGLVDPRHTALLETTPPVLSRPQHPQADTATVTSYAPDQIRLTTTSDAASMLMLSEVYYPAWHAYVDGQPVKLYEADHVLRGVAVPAGTHTVELRFQSRSLDVGLVISLVAFAIFLGLLGAAGWRRWRPNRRRSS